MGEPVLQGSLQSFTVPDLLTFINIVKKTGALVLTRGAVTKSVYWDRGEMVFASSTDPEESLGNFLVRHGKITPEQHMKSGLLVGPGKRQGKVLVQIGALSPSELWWGVKNQVLEIIYSVFHWNDGRFSFEETSDSPEEKIKLSVSTTNVIMEGIRRLDEWPRIREHIPSDRLVPVLAPEEGRDRSVTFYEEETNLLALVDGRRTVRDIIYLSKLNEFETLRVLLSFILSRYVVLPCTSAAPAGEEAEDVESLRALVEGYNRAFGNIRLTLDAGVGPERGRELFERALASAANPELEGLTVRPDGLLDTEPLLANVAEMGSDERPKALEKALSNFLSFLLFESSKHLGTKEKADIYRMVEEWAGRHSQPNLPGPPP